MMRMTEFVAMALLIAKSAHLVAPLNSRSRARALRHWWRLLDIHWVDSVVKLNWNMKPAHNFSEDHEK